MHFLSTRITPLENIQYENDKVAEKGDAFEEATPY